jgi:hypothetical protein
MTEAYPNGLDPTFTYSNSAKPSQRRENDDETCDRDT